MLYCQQFVNRKIVDLLQSDYQRVVYILPFSFGRFFFFYDNDPFPFLGKKMQNWKAGKSRREYTSAESVMSHIDWGGEQTTIYKGVETFP